MASAIGNNRSMLLANHGILTLGQTVAEAFDELYYFEKACETYLTALSTNKELNVVSSEVAEKTAQEWENYPVNMGEQHLSEIKKILDKEDISYRD
jgi:ribulose-5-phosphate 4-epimerase/fuculose-1-phosphate aldolase